MLPFSAKQQLDQIQDFFGEREYRDKFPVSFSQLLFDKSQLVSYELENRKVKTYEKTINNTKVNSYSQDRDVSCCHARHGWHACMVTCATFALVTCGCFAEDRQRNVPKCKMHLQSGCFCSLNLLFCSVVIAVAIVVA